MSRREGGVVDGVAAAQTICRGDGDGMRGMSGGSCGSYGMWR